MQDTNNPQNSSAPPEDHVREVMGPTPEESKPVSVPNESALPVEPTGAVIAPEQQEKTKPEDAPKEPEKPKEEDYRTWHEKLKHNLRRWWKNPKTRWASIIGIALFLLFIGLFPFTRYFVLNTFGVRSSASLTILDESTGQPLKNVQVTLRGQTVKTDTDGKVALKHLKLGSTKLEVKRRAFADINKKITLGWGSNPLGNFDLKPVGMQYSFALTDFLSGKPIADAEINSGDLAARSDKDGNAVLTVDSKDEEEVEAQIVAEGYRKELITITADTEREQNIKLASSRKQPFISKRNGKFDLYKIDIDGKNEEIAVKATGNEEENIALVSHPTDELVAMISTRENVRNRDGFLLQTLTVVNLSDNGTRVVAQAEKIQIMGWVGSRLLYAQVGAGASGLDPNRHRLWAYDYSSQKLQELASNNGFNDAALIGKNLYYAPSSALTPGSKPNLHRIAADANNKQVLLDREVWNIFRGDYETVYFAAQNEWYQVKTDASKATKLTNPPANLKHRLYHDRADGKKSIWIDERDGKGTLLLYDTESKKEEVIKQQPGAISSVRWLDEKTIVYTSQSSQESAMYALSLDGGDAKKIQDATKTSGLERWFYY